MPKIIALTTDKAKLIDYSVVSKRGVTTIELRAELADEFEVACFLREIKEFRQEQEAERLAGHKAAGRKPGRPVHLPQENL